VFQQRLRAMLLQLAGSCRKTSSTKQGEGFLLKGDEDLTKQHGLTPTKNLSDKVQGLI